MEVFIKFLSRASCGGTVQFFSFETFFFEVFFVLVALAIRYYWLLHLPLAGTQCVYLSVGSSQGFLARLDASFTRHILPSAGPSMVPSMVAETISEEFIQLGCLGAPLPSFVLLGCSYQVDQLQGTVVSFIICLLRH